MQRILFVITGIYKGGTEKSLINIINNLDINKYEIDILTVFKSDELDELHVNANKNYVLNYSESDLKILKKDSHNNLFKKGIKFLKVLKLHTKVLKECRKRKILEEEYDYIVDFSSLSWCDLVKNFKNGEKITWVHGDPSKINKIYRTWYKISLKKINKVICVTNEVKMAIKKAFKYEGDIHTVYNIVDIKALTKLSCDNIDYKKLYPIVISVGRLSWEKDFKTLINAHKKVIETGMKHELIIIGDGEEYDNLIELIKDNHIEDTVKLLGYKENPYPYLQIADIFVCSSISEGFSIAVLEALMLNKAIISTNCKGPREILGDGKYGKIVEVGDENELAESITEVLSNRKVREKMQMLSNERKRFFSEEAIIKSINNIFSKIK